MLVVGQTFTPLVDVSPCEICCSVFLRSDSQLDYAPLLSLPLPFLITLLCPTAAARFPSGLHSFLSNLRYVQRPLLVGLSAWFISWFPASVLSVCSSLPLKAVSVARLLLLRCVPLGHAASLETAVMCSDCVNMSA